ncbi:MAG: hypothetical protein AB8U25_01785 [Rickettsiales endosymbiont of Dermacentor nuttalli]
MPHNSKLLQKFAPSLPNLLENYMGNRIAFAASMLEGRYVTETEPSSLAAAEIENIVTEISVTYDIQAISEQAL